VLLPQPDGPTRETIVEGAMWILISRSASMRCPAPSNTRQTLWIA